MATTAMLRSDWMILLVTSVCLSIYHVHCATQAEERSSEKVKIKLYDLSTSGWSTSKRNTFSTVIASEATSYCTSSPSSCGLDSAATFTSSEVGTSSAEKDGSSIEFTFYIDFPSGASVSSSGDTDHVVPKAAAQAIAASARDEVKDEVGHYITYIDEEYYSIPPDTDTNRVIIPIAFVAVFILALAVVAFHYYQKHKERKDKIAERLTRKKQQKQLRGVGVAAGGNDVSYSALDTTTTTILTPNNSTTPRRGYNHNHYNNNNNNNNNNNFNNNNNNTINSTGLNNSLMKFTTRDNKLPLNDSMEHDETGPVVVSLSKGAQYYSPSETRKLRPMTSTSVNEFHDGLVVEGSDVPTPPKTAKPLEQMSVLETLEDDEARRERKRRRKEKRKERKRREEAGEAGGDRAMETSYENPTFNSSNLSEGSYTYLN